MAPATIRRREGWTVACGGTRTRILPPRRAARRWSLRRLHAARGPTPVPSECRLSLAGGTASPPQAVSPPRAASRVRTRLIPDKRLPRCRREIRRHRGRKEGRIRFEAGPARSLCRGGVSRRRSVASLRGVMIDRPTACQTEADRPGAGRSTAIPAGVRTTNRADSSCMTACHDSPHAGEPSLSALLRSAALDPERAVREYRDEARVAARSHAILDAFSYRRLLARCRRYQLAALLVEERCGACAQPCVPAPSGFGPGILERRLEGEPRAERRPGARRLDDRLGRPALAPA